MEQRDFAVLVGRCCPMHMGHEEVIKAMITKYGNNCFVGIGSANHPLSIRHFFSYRERRGFILRVFPDLTVCAIPDFPTDEEWMLALDDMIRVSGAEPSTTTFFGGCEEDVQFFYRFGRKVEIMNRFDGTTPKISATEVRDALIHQRRLDGLLNPLIAESVARTFQEKWETFKKM